MEGLFPNDLGKSHNVIQESGGEIQRLGGDLQQARGSNEQARSPVGDYSSSFESASSQPIPSSEPIPPCAQHHVIPLAPTVLGIVREREALLEEKRRLFETNPNDETLQAVEQAKAHLDEIVPLMANILRVEAMCAGMFRYRY